MVSKDRKMDVRAQVSMVFHLDKCIGCHTCSLACKNLWSDRQGAEYMWWNNVETKPGTGFPSRWEDQEQWRGGWKRGNGHGPTLRSQGKIDGLLKLFYNSRQPDLKDYYEPWTYRYADLFDAPESDDIPTARPVSQITGKPIDIRSGPNWDDDLSGSPRYAADDPNLASLSDDERRELFEVERLTMMYLPRSCNHCTNPACVAACPSGAIYKRGEDGVVLINQEACRGWRSCVVACPYKKSFYNWSSGRSEKCILCYPRLESGQAPACFHGCVGRVRYMGVVLYDASWIRDIAGAPDEALVDAQRSMILDPFDSAVVGAAEECGVPAQMIESARKSPIWRFVREWGLALPLHPEFRTLPMLFYVPPLMPVIGRRQREIYSRAERPDGNLFAEVDEARLPIAYLASLFSAGDPAPVRAALRKLMAVRWYRRSKEVKDVDAAMLQRLLGEAGITAEDAEAIYRLTSLATLEERFALPPLQREEAIAAERRETAEFCRGTIGFGATPSTGRRP
jgi:nitrate reductase beta subunit